MTAYFRSIILFLAMDITVAQAQDSVSISVDGYIKDMQTFQFYYDFDQTYVVDLLHNRISAKLSAGDHLSARLDLRNRIFVGDLFMLAPDFGAQLDKDPGWVDMSETWVDEPQLALHSTIDRGYVRYSDRRFDITAGRQRINWGIHTIWNPNDIFNAYNFLDFDYEERPGSDAIRMQYYLPDASSLEFAVAPDSADQIVAAVLYKWNMALFDLQALSGVFREDYVVGAGWAGSIGKIGWKGECSYFHPKDDFTDTSGVWSLTMGFDRTFSDDWYVSVSGLYNSNPGNSVLLQSADARLSAKSLFPFTWSWYAGAMYAISPITAVNIACIYAPENLSLLLLPSFSWEVSENFDTDITVQAFFADAEKKYTNFITACYIRGKWSF